MENNQLAQYYNEQFKQTLDPPFETLTPEDVIRLEKIVNPSFGFAAWKLNKACEQTAIAFKECFQKLKFTL